MQITRRSILAGVCGLALTPAASADDTPLVRYRVGPGGVSVDTVAARENTAFAIASLGKTMTAVAVLRRVASGALRLDAPATDWIAPDIANGLGGLNGITLRHLLTMTSGLPEYYTDDYLFDALDDPTLQTPEIALSYAFGNPPLFAPGRRYDYANTNYVLLGLILEAEGGRSYAQIMQREVFGPAGMTDSFVFGSRPLPASFASVPRHVRAYYEAPGFGDGGVIATAPDVARFYRAVFLDQTLLPASLLAEMTRDPLGAGYGMGIGLGRSIVGHSGGDLGFSSDVRLHRPSGVIAVMLVAEDDAETGWVDDQMPD